MKRGAQTRKRPLTVPGKLAQWLLDRLHRSPQRQPQLALLERIALAPRQSLALVEADGQRLLVATSPECAPAFYVLDAKDIRQPDPRACTIPVRGTVC